MQKAYILIQCTILQVESDLHDRWNDRHISRGLRVVKITFKLQQTHNSSYNSSYKQYSQWERLKLSYNSTFYWGPCATQIAQLNVGENTTIGASSSAAAVSIDTQRSAVRCALSAVGVVVDRRSAKFVDVASFNSLITHQKVLHWVGRYSVEGLASLDSSVSVD